MIAVRGVSVRSVTGLVAAIAGSSFAIAAAASPGATSNPPAAIPSTSAPAAHGVDACTLLNPANDAAQNSRAVPSSQKAAAALAQARAAGCPNHVAAKQASTSAGMTALAHSLGVDETSVSSALRAVKQDGSTDPNTQARTFASALGVAQATAQGVLQQLMAAAHPDAQARVWASRLQVAVDRAQWALDRIRELEDQPGGVQQSSPDFAAIAQQLSVTPTQLWSGLDAARRAATAPISSPSPAAVAPAPSPSASR